ncbi:MAG: hypothetical protein AB7N76_32690 [Planctomycetota bacterium]
MSAEEPLPAPAPAPGPAQGPGPGPGSSPGPAPGPGPAPADEQGHRLRAAFAIRLLVLRRRYGSPLELVALLVSCLLASWLGQKLQARLPAGPDAGTSAAAVAAAALSALLALGLPFCAAAGERALYRRRELTLLLANGLGPAQLVRLRARELLLVGAPLALLPLALASGLAGARSPLLLLAVPPLALGLAGAALAGGWLWGGLGAGARRALLLGLALAALALIAAAPRQVVAALGHEALPGHTLLELARGRLAPAALVWAALAAAAPPLGLWLAPSGYGARLDRAAPRPSRSRGALAGRALAALLAPLGAQAAALARRDLLLILRGGFVRGALILVALPAAAAVVPAAAADPGLTGWQLRLAALLVCGVMSAGAGFLFGVDFPLARRGQLVVERTQPLRARAVLRSRWAPAAAYAGALVLLVSAAVAAQARPALAREAPGVLGAGLLLALLVTHHAVSFGMYGEAEANPAESGGYPFVGGTVVVLFGLGVAGHWGVAALYPLLWFGYTRRALARWERAEVIVAHGAGA